LSTNLTNQDERSAFIHLLDKVCKQTGKKLRTKQLRGKRKATERKLKKKFNVS